MEELDKDRVRYNITWENIAKIWSTKDLLGRDERELLVLHHRIKHCTSKSLLILYKRGILPRKIIKVITPPLVLPNYLESTTRYHGVPRVNT